MRILKNQVRFDHTPVPASLRQAQTVARFVEGSTEPITPEDAYHAMHDGEGASAAAARQRMIDRHSRTHSQSAAEARERMIQRGNK